MQGTYQSNRSRRGQRAGGHDHAHMPQLDGLRAIAVAMVLLAHCWLRDSHIGHYGVRIFFVLSGFLITGILLDLRERIESQGTAQGGIWRAFFLRRALRIFPAYFVFLGVILLIGVPGLKDQLPWHVLFLSNISIFINADWEPWQVTHLWSLSVEEQFYLLWPALILLAPRRALAPVFLMLVTLAVLWRTLCLVLGMTEFGAFLTPASFDALAGGATIALAARDGWLRGLQRACLFLAPVWIVLIVAVEVGRWEAPHWITWDVAEALGTAVFVGVVAAASTETTGPVVSRCLSWGPLCRLGRISYGIYLYHVLAMWFVTEAIARTNIIPFSYGPAFFVLSLVLTVILAEASWRVLERPFLRLKRHVPYLPAHARKERADIRPQVEQ